MLPALHKTLSKPGLKHGVEKYNSYGSCINGWMVLIDWAQKWWHLQQPHHPNTQH